MERRLFAILVAEVVGYSHLIRAEEEGTIAAGGRGLPSSCLGLAISLAKACGRQAERGQDAGVEGRDRPGSAMS